MGLNIKMRNSTHCILLIIIIISALLLRVAYIDKQSLWLDEAITVRQANVGLNQTIYQLSHDDHFPLYIVLMHFWIKIFGISESAIRSLSAIFGILGVLMIYFLGRRLFNKETGLFAAAILALSPAAIYYSQEARLYTMMMFLTMASFYFYLRLKEKYTVLNAALYIIPTILLIYTHIFAFIIVLSQTIHFFYINSRKKAELAKWAVTMAILGVLFLPWAPIMINQLSLTSLISWIPRPSINGLAGTGRLFFGNAIIAIIFFMLLGFIFFLNIKGRIDPDEAGNFYSVLFFGAFPIVFLFLFSFIKPLFVPKFMLFALPFFILAFAWMTLKSHNKPMLPLIILVIILVMSLTTVFWQYHTLDKQDWRGVAEYIRMNAKQDEYIFLDPYYDASPFAYYYDRGCQVEKYESYAADCLYKKHDLISVRYDMKCCSEDNYVTSTDGKNRLGQFLDKPIWLIEDNGQMRGSAETLFSYLNKRKNLTSSRDFAGNLTIYKFG